MNEEWVKEVFEPNNAIKDIYGKKIEVNKKEVYEAICNIAKNKACSVDGITDSLFKKS